MEGSGRFDELPVPSGMLKVKNENGEVTISGTTPSQYRESCSETPAPLHIQQNDYQSENRREFRINYKDYLEIRRIR